MLVSDVRTGRNGRTVSLIAGKPVQIENWHGFLPPKCFFPMLTILPSQGRPGYRGLTVCCGFWCGRRQCDEWVRFFGSTQPARWLFRGQRQQRHRQRSTQRRVPATLPRHRQVLRLHEPTLEQRYAGVSIICAARFRGLMNLH